MEKRVNSHQEILAFFEDATYTLQVPSDRAAPLHELIQTYGLDEPWGVKGFSLMRNGFWNRDSRKLLKILSNKTLLGEIREVLLVISADLVAAHQGRSLRPDEIDAVVGRLGARH